MNQITVEVKQDRIQWLVAVRPRLVSFARLQLRDLARAEEAVQEAIAAAIEKDGTFTGNRVTRPGSSVSSSTRSSMP